MWCRKFVIKRRANVSGTAASSFFSKGRGGARNQQKRFGDLRAREELFNFHSRSHVLRARRSLWRACGRIGKIWIHTPSPLSLFFIHFLLSSPFLLLPLSHSLPTSLALYLSPWASPFLSGRPSWGGSLVLWVNLRRLLWAGSCPRTNIHTQNTQNQAPTPNLHHFLHTQH